MNVIFFDKHKNKNLNQAYPRIPSFYFYPPTANSILVTNSNLQPPTKEPTNQPTTQLVPQPTNLNFDTNKMVMFQKAGPSRKKFNTEAQRLLQHFLYDDDTQVLTTFDTNRIASLTYGESVCGEIFELLDYTITEITESSTLSIHKSLILMEHIIAYGSEMAVNATWYLLPKVSPLRQYNTVLLRTKNTSTFSAKMHRIVGGSVDHGLPVREVAERLFVLLSDTDKIHNLRSQKNLSLRTLVPVGDRDETFFVTDELRKAALDDKMKEQIKQQKEQQRLKGRSNLKLARGGFGGGYNAADGSAGNVVGAAHSIEEMLVAARRDLESKKGYRDAADGKTNIPNGFSDVAEGEYNPPNSFGDNNNNNNTNFNDNVLKEQYEREEYLTCLEMEIAAKKEEAAKYGFVPQAVDLLDFGQSPNENNMALRYQEQGSPVRTVTNRKMVNDNNDNNDNVDVMVVPSMNDAPFQSVVSGPSYIVSPPNDPNPTTVLESVAATENETDSTNVNHINAPPSNVTNVHQHVDANYGNDVVPANNTDCANNVNNHRSDINDNTNPGPMLDLLDFTGDDHLSNQPHYPPHQYQHRQEQSQQQSIQHTNSYPTSPQPPQGRKPAMNHPPSDLFPIDLLDPSANVTTQSVVIPSPVVDSEQERHTPSTTMNENLSLPGPPPPMDAPPSPPSIQEQELVQEQEQVAIDRQLQRQQPSMQVQQQQVQQSMQAQQHVQQMQQQQQQQVQQPPQQVQQPPQQVQQPPQQQSNLDPMKQMQNNMSHMQEMMMTNNTKNNVANLSGINGGNDGGAMNQEQMQAKFHQMMEIDRKSVV